MRRLDFEGGRRAKEKNKNNAIAVKRVEGVVTKEIERSTGYTWVWFQSEVVLCCKIYTKVKKCNQISFFLFFSFRGQNCEVL